MWVPHPSQIVTLTDSGQGNMGDVTDVDSKGRFTLDADVFVLVFIRGGFITSAGSADLYIKLDSRHALPDVTEVIGAGLKVTPFDFLLYTVKGVGTDGRQVNFRIQPFEMPHWSFRRGDVLVFDWTNPGTQEWGLEVGLADATGALQGELR